MILQKIRMLKDGHFFAPQWAQFGNKVKQDQTIPATKSFLWLGILYQLTHNKVTA